MNAEHILDKISARILEVRGKRVLLDADRALLYGVESPGSKTRGFTAEPN